MAIAERPLLWARTSALVFLMYGAGVTTVGNSFEGQRQVVCGLCCVLRHNMEVTVNKLCSKVRCIGYAVILEFLLF